MAFGATYTLVYTMIATNVSTTALATACAAVPRDTSVEDALGLSLTSDDTEAGSPDVQNVQRTIIYTTTSKSPISDPEMSGALTNLYTKVLSKALAVPVVPSPVVVT